MSYPLVLRLGIFTQNISPSHESKSFLQLGFCPRPGYTASYHHQYSSWLYEEKRIVAELNLDFFFPFFSLFPIQDLYQYKIEVTCL